MIISFCMATYISEQEVLNMPYKRFVAYMDDIDYINSEKEKQSRIDRSLERTHFGFDGSHDEFNQNVSKFLRNKEN